MEEGRRKEGGRQHMVRWGKLANESAHSMFNEAGMVASEK